MTNRIYKSARGKTVDMGKLLLQNEKVRAVGNMGVNARGDKIDSFNRVVKSRAAQSTERYRSNVSSQTPTSPVTPQNPSRATADNPVVNKLSADVDVTSGEFLNVTPPPPVESDPAVGGLASALKKAGKKDTRSE